MTSVRPEERVVLMIGTRKGSFLFTSDLSRRKWEMRGPFQLGDDIFHMTYDGRGEGMVYAAVNRMIWGSEVQRSADLGVTWQTSEHELRFEEGSGETLKRVWHIEPGRLDEPGVLYAGVEPAALFKSDDGGASWQEVKGLSGHPTRPQWQPGNGGLCLHSFVLDGDNASRRYVGISAVGTLRTDDGGVEWAPKNKGVHAHFLPEPMQMPEFGQCVHKLLQAPSGRLYQQNHCGVYRSDNGGDSWDDISAGLPSRFGFVLGLHPRDSQTLYVVPEDQGTPEEVGGGFRVVTGGMLRVFRSKDGGDAWQPLTKGLPQQNAFLHLMREGMAVDSADPCGIYFGTTSGQVFYSRDEGESWELLAEHLPPINSVEVALRG